MARQIKERILSTRVDNNLGKQIDGYVEAAELTQGELIRMAVIEYMTSHPIKPPVEPFEDTINPGKEPNE